VRWLLDTDVICQPAKKKSDSKVIAWLEVEQDRCYTSAVVIAQLAYWVRTKDGRRRQTVQAWLTRLVDALHGRIHGFNESVAHVWAEQERLLEKAGQRMSVEDSYIAARAPTRIDDGDGERPRLQATWVQGLQPVQGAPISHGQLSDGLTGISGSEQDGDALVKRSRFILPSRMSQLRKSSNAAS
jgi:toxin FitB